MHMLFETCACEELNKLELYVHAAGGKCFKFEDNPSFFSLSGCSTTVHLLDHRHFHVLGIVVVGQIKVLDHGKTSSMVAGIVIMASFSAPSCTRKLKTWRVCLDIDPCHCSKMAIAQQRARAPHLFSSHCNQLIISFA